MTTQADRIEWMLRAAGKHGVCATTFLRNYMPTYSQRIGELKRKRGLNITTGPCEAHTHESHQIRYYLTEKPPIDVDAAGGYHQAEDFA